MRTRSRTAAGSFMGDDHGYVEKPSIATRTPRTRFTRISPGRPVTPTRRRSSARTVCPIPMAPKSNAWLFARFAASTPARRSEPAFSGGPRKAKQCGDGCAPHLEVPVVARVPSWLTAVRSAARSEPATGPSSCQPWPAGSPRSEPSVVSPAQAMLSRRRAPGVVWVGVGVATTVLTGCADAARIAARAGGSSPSPANTTTAAVAPAASAPIAPARATQRRRRPTPIPP